MNSVSGPKKFPREAQIQIVCITDFRSSGLNLVAGNEPDLRKSEKSVDRSSFSRIIHRLRRFSQIHIKLHQNAEITAKSAAGTKKSRTADNADKRG